MTRRLAGLYESTSPVTVAKKIVDLVLQYPEVDVLAAGLQTRDARSKRQEIALEVAKEVRKMTHGTDYDWNKLHSTVNGVLEKAWKGPQDRVISGMNVVGAVVDVLYKMYLTHDYEKSPQGKRDTAAMNKKYGDHGKSDDGGSRGTDWGRPGGPSDAPSSSSFPSFRRRSDAPGSFGGFGGGSSGGGGAGGGY